MLKAQFVTKQFEDGFHFACDTSTHVQIIGIGVDTTPEKLEMLPGLTFESQSILPNAPDNHLERCETCGSKYQKEHKRIVVSYIMKKTDEFQGIETLDNL